MTSGPIFPGLDQGPAQGLLGQQGLTQASKASQVKFGQEVKQKKFIGYTESENATGDPGQKMAPTNWPIFRQNCFKNAPF